MINSAPELVRVLYVIAAKVLLIAPASKFNVSIVKKEFIKEINRVIKK